MPQSDTTYKAMTAYQLWLLFAPKGARNASRVQLDPFKCLGLEIKAVAHGC